MGQWNKSRASNARLAKTSTKQRRTFLLCVTQKIPFSFVSQADSNYNALPYTRTATHRATASDLPRFFSVILSFLLSESRHGSASYFLFSEKEKVSKEKRYKKSCRRVERFCLLLSRDKRRSAPQCRNTCQAKTNQKREKRKEKREKIWKQSK